MNKLIRGVVAVAGCVVLGGVSAAEELYVRGYFDEDGRYVLPDVRVSPPSREVDRRPVRRKVEPEAVKERTRDVLRAKRPR
ncbi:MAG TPA: hypothetical protein VIU34_08265 [Steroidobacter sp.]